jgi:hypothetical protein
MEKQFYTQDNIGKVKYTVNFHDGVQTHKDGSPFFGIRCFSNKKKRDKCVRDLKKENYTER